MSKLFPRVSLCVLAVAAAAGCASKPTAPFDTLPQSTVYAFRLQNYEPPATTPIAPGGGVAIPGLPPEIQQWAQTAAQALPQLLPPGLLPPGLVPGATTTPTTPTTGTAKRFPAGSTPNFAILGQTTVMDEELKTELAKLLGNESSYENATASCLYAELGLNWVAPTGASNDLLISFSCNQVQLRGSSAWPFPGTGMKAGTVKDLTELVKKIFPPGT